MMKVQIEPILSEIEDAGLKVLNLFQLPNGVWQANLYDGEKAWNFGLADEPALALSLAFTYAKTTPGTTMTPKGVETLLDNLF